MCSTTPVRPFFWRSIMRKNSFDQVFEDSEKAFCEKYPDFDVLHEQYGCSDWSDHTDLLPDVYWDRITEADCTHAFKELYKHLKELMREDGKLPPSDMVEAILGKEKELPTDIIVKATIALMERGIRPAVISGICERERDPDPPIHLLIVRVKDGGPICFGRLTGERLEMMDLDAAYARFVS
jgi:hypothetical protein